MRNDEYDKSLEERIHFIAKHYKEERLDVDQAWAKFAQEKQIRKMIPFRRFIYSAASVLLLLIGIGSLYIWNKNQPEWILISSHLELKDIYLPDSSQVTLAANSSIRYNAKKFNKEDRSLELTGKGWFEVAADPASPFSVKTRLAEVTVLGTSFQVLETDVAVQVDVFTGRVRFEAGEQKDEIILTAGMSAVYKEEAGRIEINQPESKNQLSWKTGTLIFNETPLQQVIKDLQEYYKISIQNKVQAEGMRLTATFREMPLDDVLMIINQTLDVRLSPQ